MWKQCS